MAGSRTYRTKVLVLDKTKLKETDLILTMLDERGRQVRAVAKGARKPGGRLAARCELFCTVDMLLAHGRSLDVVSQAELMEAPLGARLRDDLRRKRDRRSRARVLVRGRRGSVYLCYNAASACPGWQRARYGAYGSTCGGICL